MLSPLFLRVHSLLVAPALLSFLNWASPATYSNQPPVANPDHYTVHGTFGTPLDSEPYGVLKNDSDPDGDFLSCDFAIVNASLGTAIIFTNGRVVFTAASGRTGTVTVPYTVCDNHGFCVQSTVTFDVTNEAPAAGSDEYTVHGIFDTGVVNPPPFGVLKNDSDPEGDTLSCLEKRVDTALGTALIYPSGQATFVQNANRQTGDVSFAYTVCDNLGACSEGNVTFHVVNNAPVAINDFYIVRDPVFSSPQNSPPFGPLKNDSDPDGDSLQIEFNRVDFAQGTGFVFPNSDLYPYGRADFVRNNNYLNFTGELTMQYTLRDSLGATSQGTVTFLLIGPGENNGACGRCNETVGSPVRSRLATCICNRTIINCPA